MADHTSNAPESVNDSESPGDADQKAENVGTNTAAGDAVREIGGRGGLDPTRYGDWEKNGRCIDF
jgi:hypothetical protein